MGRRTVDPGNAPVPVNEDAPVLLAPDVVMVYESMIATVPEAGGDGLEGILRTLADAGDLAALDAPWRSEGLKAWANVPLRITGLRRMPSEYEGGLPFFLIIEGAVRATGEKVTATTGAVSVVAQLAKAWSAGWFPLDVIPRIAARPSAGGFFPMHLEVVR